LVAFITGTVSAFVGILYATTDNDTKCMLAHSSIENMAIIRAALGAGWIFTATGHAALAGVAFIAALHHLIHCSIYSALLFLRAGMVDDRAGTRDLDGLGGLIHRMPRTALLFLVGALSIGAIYPFNGFASDWTRGFSARVAQFPRTGGAFRCWPITQLNKDEPSDSAKRGDRLASWRAVRDARSIH
jgi:NADH:ubiquinone oxidoreductase subunit 5 (subunit L)/multisubunit Na+/H+ antiporter MnhA subunit